MTLLKKTLAGLAVASLAISPAVAAPTDRGSPAVEDANAMGGDWLGILGAILVVALAAFAAFGDDDDEAVSP